MSVCDLRIRFDRCVRIESQGRWARLELHWECVLYEDGSSLHLTSHGASWFIKVTSWFTIREVKDHSGDWRGLDVTCPGVKKIRGEGGI